LKYEEPPKFDNKETLKLLKSEKESDQIMGLLSIVQKSGDYNLSMKKSLEFTQSDSDWIKGCGIECFGHIARIYDKIEINIIKEVLKGGLKSKSKLIKGKSEDAIDDITHFLKLDRNIFE
jgi:hypothetical protein